MTRLSSAAASAAHQSHSTALSPASSAGTALSPSAYLDHFAREQLPPLEQWPELRFDLPELRYRARLNCVAELLDAAIAAGRGARTAVIGAHASWTYEQLQQHVDRIAH